MYYEVCEHIKACHLKYKKRDTELLSNIRDHPLITVFVPAYPLTGSEQVSH